MHRYCQNVLLSLVGLPLSILPFAAQAQPATDAALNRVPIEVRFDMLNPCIEQKLNDPSIGMSADVYVDGHLDRSVVNHNGSGREQLELTAGAHDVEVTAEGYSADQKTIMVRDDARQRFAFHVRTEVEIVVEVTRTHDPEVAHKLLKKLSKAGEPATIRTIHPESTTEPQLLVVQIGPFPNCAAAEKKAALFEAEHERAAYVVAAPR